MTDAVTVVVAEDAPASPPNAASTRAALEALRGQSTSALIAAMSAAQVVVGATVGAMAIARVVAVALASDACVASAFVVLVRIHPVEVCICSRTALFPVNLAVCHQTRPNPT